ncbi:MAG TPA: hypothetical protein VKC59_04590, partial [Candidatus Limnocylindrales bacterium]|nr:hypothetical protein [Candidatus Limnocylindrales bacterium]
MSAILLDLNGRQQHRCEQAPESAAVSLRDRSFARSQVSILVPRARATCWAGSRPGFASNSRGASRRRMNRA